METRDERKDPSRRAGTLGRYRTLLLIGEGGMGRVELALERGEGGFERVVALKRMRPEVARDARHTEMFLHEARLAALLSHPNVVHTFAFGEADGELFLAMEHVQGETLGALLERVKARGGRLEPDVALSVLERVCEALHAAHELRDVKGQALGLVHRDVTPSNVMISYDGHVKLLDFGVAKIEAAGAALTRAGEVKGKMAYMSPEQAMGDPLDRRSDLYAVGALLYEAMTGERMWGDGAELEIMRRMSKGDAPALRVGPDAIRALHAKLVAQSADARPADARAVAQELRAARSTEPDLGALMRELFADDAAKKREALDAAMLAPAAPAVETLEAEAPPATLSTRQGQPARGFAWGVASAAAVIALALAAASLALVRADSRPSAAAGADAAVAVPQSSAAASPALSASAQPSPAPLAPPSAVGAIPPKPSPVQTPKKAKAAASSSTLDVDPNPI